MQEDQQPIHFIDIKKLYSKKSDQEYNPLLGIEVEKIGLYYEKAAPPTYGGSRGYLAILGKLYEELGWEIVAQQGKKISSMKRGNAYLHLESDGRIELAGSPHDSIHDLARELRIHQNEIKEISDIFGIVWIGCGYHPFVKSADISDLLDKRKVLLLDYFNQRKQSGNDFGLAWFKKTSGIHINIDYKNEEDFARKNRVLLRIAPILTAMFANSPFSKKKFSGYMSFRSKVAHNNGLPQFDIPQSFYESELSYDDWLEHVMGLPFLMMNRGEDWMLPNCSFGQFLEQGFGSHKATLADWDLHMKSAWKEIKSKSVIELRFFDSLPPHLIPAAAALVKGLVYDNEALEYLEKLTKNWSYVDYMNLRQDADKYALQAKFEDKLILDYAKDFIELAKHSLKKKRIRDIRNQDEAIYLEPIEEFVMIKEKSPAEWLVENWHGKWRKSFLPVIDWLQY